MHGRIITLRQDSTHVHYQARFPSSSTPQTLKKEELHRPSTDDTEALLHHYLNLGPNLTTLYATWSAADPNFRKKAPKFAGVRILRQDAWEALVGFICSSNNNIIRISQMVHNLCKHYGPLIGYVDDEPYHDFPTAQALTDPNVEGHLRQLGFGYRAKYLYQTAVIVAREHEAGWLDSLRNPESPVLGVQAEPAGEMMEGGREGYRAAHAALLHLQGVGPKVADCVCLMGLGWGEAVPVDTHVWQIAQRDYKFGKGKHSSLTKATYDAVGNKFRALWGKEAGWAHSVLFTADLRAFSERLVAKIEVEEVEVVKKEESGEEDSKTTISTIKEEVKVEEIIREGSLKRESDDSPGLGDMGNEDMMSRIKRRRRTRQ